MFQPHHSETIKYVDIDIYTEIAWTFFMAQNKYTEREQGKFDSFRKLSFVWRT